MIKFLLWLLNLLQPKPPAPTPTPPDEDNDNLTDADGLFFEHNRQRTARGVSALVRNKQLDSAAQKHAAEMAYYNKMSHMGQDGSSVGERMRREGWSGRAWGENIAAGQDDYQEAMQSWMNSTGHRQNILDSKYSDVGFGIAENKNGVPYWCAVFGG